MIHSRLERLSPDARRALRAASIFGPVFTSKGVRRLIGKDLHDAALAKALEELADEELIARTLFGSDVQARPPLMCCL